MSYTPYFAFPKDTVCVSCGEPIKDGDKVHVCFITTIYQHPDDSYNEDYEIAKGMFSCELGPDAELMHVVCPEQMEHSNEILEIAKREGIEDKKE